MKFNDDGSISYTMFEVYMSQIFFEIGSSSTLPLHEQYWWKDIQTLKKLAQDELKEEITP